MHEQIWLSSILQSSIVVDDEMYSGCANHIADQQQKLEGNGVIEFNFVNRSECGIQLDSLPKTPSPTLLADRIVAGRIGCLNRASDEFMSAVEDAALLKMSPDGTRDELIRQIRAAYFALPVVQNFVAWAEPSCYFGQAKRWLQHASFEKRRSHLTPHVRKLFDWIIELGNGRYFVTRPHYSERLEVIRDKTAFTAA